MKQWIQDHRSAAKLLGCAAIGILIWILPHPQGLTQQAWHMFAVFFATILAIILKPYPMSVISILGLTAAISTGLLSLEDACNGFGSEIVWLIVFAFFIARGFISTGLGNRVAYSVMKTLGKNSLGLGYGMVATDLLLAPCIPSVTARAGGVLYPIVKSLAEVFTGKSHDPKMGAFLAICAYQATAVTGAMFLTAMAGNPLIVRLAQGYNISISWTSWCTAAIVPGLISLLIFPWVIYKLWTPTIRHTPHAREMASDKLRLMGAMSLQEKIMGLTFVLLIVLWIAGPFIHMKATTAAMIGVSILLLTGILKWKDALEETAAWDTLIWFATLVTLACQLNKTGFSTWFSQYVVGHISGFHWSCGFLILALIYYYSHYFFASAVAHIGAMFAPFLAVAIALGTPPELAALSLGFFSNLFTGLTHYGSGAAPILFGSGYVSVNQWWKAGAVCSIIFIACWILVGGFWWKILGLW